MLVTDRNFSEVMEWLNGYDRLNTDTETNGLHTWRGARLIGISIAPPKCKRKDCWYFPFRHKQGRNLGTQRMKWVLALLSRKKLTCWNGKFDAHMMNADGAKIRDDMVEDVELLLHLLDENQWKTGGSYELKIAAERYINKNARASQLALTNRLADLGLGKGDMQELDPEEVEEYASDDVFYTDKLRELLYPAAEEWEIADMWQEVSEYSMVTRRMEDRGFKIDVGLAKSYINECRRHTRRIKGKIDQMVGHEINLRSNPQLQNWLQLPSTAADYIDEVYWRLDDEQKEGITALQEYRKWDRADTAYYTPFVENVDAAGVFHPNILLHGTISGRPSARGTPNVFAIPVYDDVYKVKDVITARPGYTLISADYGQAELRLAAHYSGDEFNIKCFNEGKSPHRLLLADLLAQEVDIDYEDTKRVSFAVMYGTGAPTLSKELKKSVEFAQRVLKAAHALHPNYRPMLKQAEKLARRHGYIRLWTGRVRHFNTLPDPQPWYHKACSNLIQGGVGEIMRHAICRLAKSLPAFDTHMLLQVYDQILFEAPDALVKKVVAVVRRDMTRDFPFSVPLVADIKVGKRWGKLKEVV